MNDTLDSDGDRFWTDGPTCEGLKLGRSGLETLIVILAGLGETDRNHTVLLGITFYPTSREMGSFGGTTLDTIICDTLVEAPTADSLGARHWKKLEDPLHWHEGQCLPA